MVRIQTTGGGGWGDPAERDADLIERDRCWSGARSRRAPCIGDSGLRLARPRHTARIAELGEVDDVALLSLSAGDGERGEGRAKEKDAHGVRRQRRTG